MLKVKKEAPTQSLAQSPQVRLSLRWALHSAGPAAASVPLPTPPHGLVLCVSYNVNQKVCVKCLVSQALPTAAAIICCCWRNLPTPHKRVFPTGLPCLSLGRL